MACGRGHPLPSKFVLVPPSIPPSVVMGKEDEVSGVNEHPNHGVGRGGGGIWVQWGSLLHSY